MWFSSSPHLPMIGFTKQRVSAPTPAANSRMAFRSGSTCLKTRVLIDMRVPDPLSLRYVHILSTPQILTLDNEEAEIYAGENRPYQTRAETSSANVDYSSYEYKDVGTTLKITPQISQERFVRLNVYQEVTKLASTTDSVDRPTTLKRTAKTAVVIKDGNTIVIGGLVGEDITTEEWKVPCLGNMPLLGWLFKYQSETRNNTNLFIFITPHIVENPAEATAIYQEKKEHIDKVEEGVIKSLRRKYRDEK